MSQIRSESDASVNRPMQYPIRQEPASPNRVGAVEKPNVLPPAVGQMENLLKFEEPTQYNLDEFEYERKGSNPGKLVIFNHERYDNTRLNVRRGSKRDVNEIIICFQRLGFNISIDDVVTDGTAKQVQDKIDAVLADKQTLSESNSLVIFFLTHGDIKDTLAVKDGHINCSDVWVKFNDCKELEYKPKLFVFQACKGKGFASSDSQPVFKNPALHAPVLLDMNNFTVNDLGPDMLLLYSTLEGYVSFRNPLTGTWFIQELCKNFSSYGRRDDVISLITRTTKCVSNIYYTINPEDDKICKQMPIYVSTLTKKFYLNRNKDRHLLLEMNRKQDEIHAMLEELVTFIRNK